MRNNFPPPPTKDEIIDNRSGGFWGSVSWLKWFGLVARDLQTDDVAPDTPTGLQLTTGLENVDQVTVAYIVATFDNNTEEDLDFYTVRLFKGAETFYQEYSVSIPESGSPSFKFSPLVPGGTYHVDVRAVDDSGNGSDFSAKETIASAGDTTAPATPTGLAAAAVGVKQIRATWTDNTESDLHGYELHASTSSGFTPSVSTKIAFVDGANTYTYDTPTYGTYYFKLRAKDRSGNYSGYTSEVSATSVQVVTADITDANITTAKIADANITTAKIADANVTTAKIADANITTAKIANLAVTTATIADLNVTTLKINGQAVTTDKRQNMNSVSSGYSLSADQLFSGAEGTLAHSLGKIPTALVYTGNANVAGWVYSADTTNLHVALKELSSSSQSGTLVAYYW